MRRVLVVGGTGFFGSAAAELLRARGMAPIVAARGRVVPPILRIDAENPSSLRAVLRPGDVVVDAAGPFHDRTEALVQAAADAGCDVIDLSDSIDHVEKIDALRGRIESAGIRVMTSCSSVTTLAAALVAIAEVHHPVRISICLAPASAATARAGTSGALAHSLGRTIRVFRGGTVRNFIGWSESRPFEMSPPVGRGRGYLMESAQALTLPRLWPTLRDTDFWVDSRVLGMNRLFALAARRPAVRRLLERLRRRGGVALARVLGSRAGGMLVEIVSESGAVTEVRVQARRRSYLAAVVPAVLAASDLAGGGGPAPGLVPHDRHVDPKVLVKVLADLGIDCVVSRAPSPVDS